MSFSKRCQYAVLAVYELSKQHESGPISATTIAAEQSIPKQFLQNILAHLRRGGIIHAYRGKQGGYSLAQSPEDISVGSIIRLMEGNWKIVGCLQSNDYDCELKCKCVLEQMWRNLHESVESVFDSTTFASLVNIGKSDFINGSIENLVCQPISASD